MRVRDEITVMLMVTLLQRPIAASALLFVPVLGVFIALTHMVFPSAPSPGWHSSLTAAPFVLGGLVVSWHLFQLRKKLRVKTSRKNKNRLMLLSMLQVLYSTILFSLVLLVWCIGVPLMVADRHAGGALLQLSCENPTAAQYLHFLIDNILKGALLDVLESYDLAVGSCFAKPTAFAGTIKFILRTSAQLLIVAALIDGRRAWKQWRQVDNSKVRTELEFERTFESIRQRVARSQSIRRHGRR